MFLHKAAKLSAQSSSILISAKSSARVIGSVFFRRSFIISVSRFVRYAELYKESLRGEDIEVGVDIFRFLVGGSSLELGLSSRKSEM